MAVGQWLRRDGYQVPLDYRVLTVDGRMPRGFVAAGAGGPIDADDAITWLMGEGVTIDARARAAQDQRFTVLDWDA